MKIFLDNFIFILLITSVCTKDLQGIGDADELSFKKESEESEEETPRNISIDASGSTSLTVKWDPPSKVTSKSTINGYKIKYRIKGADKKIDTITVDGSRQVYQLNNLKKNTQYLIKIAAIVNNQTWSYSDWIASETAAADLDESRVPNTPGPIRLEATAKTITVSWQPPENKSVLVRGYTIAWGIGVPDDYRHVLPASDRSYTLTGIKPTNEYVVAVRAYNNRGDGPPRYESIWTKDLTTPEPKIQIAPPVGLSANVISPTSVILSWTDTSLPARSSDNRLYIVRYSTNSHTSNPKYKYLNTTQQSILIEDLKPFMQYEFAVKISKGRKDTTWSMSVFNTTQESTPSSWPEDFTVVASIDESDPTKVFLHWQPPEEPNGQITGYVIRYTVDKSLPDNDWTVESVSEDKLTTVLHDLSPDTTYYFKIQVRNKQGYGPLSQPVAFRTLSIQTAHASNSMALLIASISGIVILLIIVVSILLYKSHRYASGTPKSPSRKHKGYIAASTSPLGKLKSGKELNPPDLWIHHSDHIELEGMDKSQNILTPTRRNAEEMLLNRKNPIDLYYDDVNKSPTPASDSISYASGSSTTRRTAKPKPLTISGDNLTNVPLIKPNLGFEPSTALSRPLYPRTQLNIQRAHVTLDNKDNPIAGQHFYDPVAVPSMHMSIACTSGNSGNQINNTANVSYSSANNFGIVANPSVNTLTRRPSAAGPLKTFSVSSSQNMNSMISPQYSPTKNKNLINGEAEPHLFNSSTLNNGSTYFDKPTSHFMTPTGRLSLTESVKKEDDALSTYSTEAFNQEKANLERVMKDLNALAEANFNMEA